MSQSKKERGKAAAALEAALRSLPRPRAPAGLEAKLLRAIPAEPPAAGRPRLWWPLTAGAAAAVAALVLAAVLYSGGGRPPWEGPAPGTLGDTSARYILACEFENRCKETKPCDTLPPLPGSP